MAMLAQVKPEKREFMIVMCDVEAPNNPLPKSKFS
jgi:hypothetical protein